MLITHEREKLIQAIIFFVNNTRHCHKVKLFKLLYFLDFEHFKVTGRSVTAMDYSAWPMGPVPVDLYAEIDLPQPDMAASVEFNQTPIRGGRQVMLDIQPRIPFSSKNFTKRELSIMTQLANEYANTSADDMIEATHLENMPWDKVYNQEGAKNQRIPYELALRSQEAEALLRVASERRELMEQLR
ncbi:Panacea domain-containing protein [uncultured Pseudomonas sp.]|uniref:Panacea domain-containing protein n=1 Tax=uncultured Pseudomonas sp. TaxID=114707 RepID=UPI002582EE13|nr:Panacea domain-containing protein [uncultured Pseudomonas sp.]